MRVLSVSSDSTSLIYTGSVHGLPEVFQTPRRQVRLAPVPEPVEAICRDNEGAVKKLAPSLIGESSTVVKDAKFWNAIAELTKLVHAGLAVVVTPHPWWFTPHRPLLSSHTELKKAALHQQQQEEGEQEGEQEEGGQQQQRPGSNVKFVQEQCDVFDLGAMSAALDGGIGRVSLLRMC